MNTHPVNLAVRFMLEICMLIALGLWGWHIFAGWQQFAAAIGFPLLAASFWGIFRIPNDPKNAPVAIPGPLRLLLEVVLFGWAIYALYQIDHQRLSYTMVIIVIVHYIASYDRTLAMISNKPYNGFLK